MDSDDDSSDDDDEDDPSLPVPARIMQAKRLLAQRLGRSGASYMLDLDGQLLAAQRSSSTRTIRTSAPDVRLQRILAQVLQVEMHIEEQNAGEPAGSDEGARARRGGASKSCAITPGGPRGLLRRRAPRLRRPPAGLRGWATATTSSPPTTPSRPTSSPRRRRWGRTSRARSAG